MTKRILVCSMAALFLGVAVVASGCSGESSSGTGAAAPVVPPLVVGGGDPKEEALQIFTGVCSVCHGLEGGGDGPGAAALDPKPRNFGDAEWQEATTDENIEKIILYGGLGVGKSAAMPANPQLNGKKEILVELRKHIRSLKRDQ